MMAIGAVVVHKQNKSQITATVGRAYGPFLSRVVITDWPALTARLVGYFTSTAILGNVRKNVHVIGGQRRPDANQFSDDRRLCAAESMDGCG